jgi:hypothetical protein
LAKFIQGCPGALKQQAIDDLGMDLNPTVELMGQGEHQVIVGDRQYLLHLLVTPGLLGLALTLRTMAVAAGVILGLTMATLITVHVQSTEGFGTTLSNGGAGWVLVGFERVLALIAG